MDLSFPRLSQTKRNLSFPHLMMNLSFSHLSQTRMILSQKRSSNGAVHALPSEAKRSRD